MSSALLAAYSLHPEPTLRTKRARNGHYWYHPDNSLTARVTNTGFICGRFEVTTEHGVSFWTSSAHLRSLGWYPIEVH